MQGEGLIYYLELMALKEIARIIWNLLWSL